MFPELYWRDAKKEKPRYSRKKDALGTPVIVWSEGEVKQAFYGTRASNRPDFYLYGAVLEVSWWMPMPPAPLEACAT